MTGFRNKARDGKLFWRGIKRQLTAALSAPAEPRKGGGGLEVKQRRYIVIKGSWKREEQKAKVRKRMTAKALAVFPSCATGAAQSYTTTRGTSMKVSILPLNSLWLYTDRGLGFRIFCGLGGRVGGL